MVDEEPIHRSGQDLLAAYRAHTGPSPEAVERLAAALRRDLAASPTSEHSVAAAPSISTNVVDLAARSRKRWTLGLGLLAAAAALGMLALRPSLTQQFAQREDPAAAFHAEPGAPASAHTRARTAAPEAPVAAPESSQPRAAELSRPRALEAALPAPAGPEAPPEPSLAAEMQHMRPAQLALAAGDPTRALTLLEVYVQTFPTGRLHEEYLALRAIARCSAGPAPAGRAEAAAFLNAHPQSMFAGRVRGACESQ